MKNALRIFATAVVLVGGAKTLDAGQRVELRVSPLVAFAPADVNVRAMVEADSANRSMLIEVDSNDFYRSSEIQLDGERAARTNVFSFRDLPSGLYELRATVRDGRGG